MIREKLLKEVRQTTFNTSQREISSLFFGPGGGKAENYMWSLVKTINLNWKAVKIRSSVIAHWLKTKDIRVVQYMAGHKYASI